MRMKKSKEVRESATVSSCTKIPYVQKAGGPLAYEKLVRTKYSGVTVFLVFFKFLLRLKSVLPISWLSCVTHRPWTMTTTTQTHLNQNWSGFISSEWKNFKKSSKRTMHSAPRMAWCHTDTCYRIKCLQALRHEWSLCQTDPSETCHYILSNSHDRSNMIYLPWQQYHIRDVCLCGKSFSVSVSFILFFVLLPFSQNKQTKKLCGNCLFYFSFFSEGLMTFLFFAWHIGYPQSPITTIYQFLTNFPSFLPWFPFEREHCYYLCSALTTCEVFLVGCHRSKPSRWWSSLGQFCQLH